MISSSLVAVSVRNSVHAVMFLVLTFLNAAALFIILGAEFLAILLIVVYVGAIAVLFLFVVMMLDVDNKAIKENIRKNLPILICVGTIFFCEIFLITKISLIKDYQKALFFPTPEVISNVEAIGNILYTDLFLPFEMAGAILFVAMIGAIVLTLRSSNRLIRKQRISDQVLRNKENSIEIIKVETGKGLEI